jgi:hypothetical protein
MAMRSLPSSAAASQRRMRERSAQREGGSTLARTDESERFAALPDEWSLATTVIVLIRQSARF